MWAVQLTGPGRMVPAEAPAPEGCPDGFVVVDVDAGGLCGSDGPFFRAEHNVWSPTDPGIPGFPMHEIVGTVSRSAYPGLDAGDRVVGWATAMDGCAEQVVTEGESLHRYRDGLSPTEAIVLQPLACVLYAVDRLGDLSGRRCAVLGLGPIGLLFAHVLRSRGAARITGVDPVGRQAEGPLFGLDDVVVARSSVWAAGIAEDDRPEVLIEAVGHQVSTLTDAVEAIALGGSLYYFGVPDDAVYPFPMERFLRKQLTMISGGTLERARVLAAADDYVREHPDLPGNLVSHVFPVHEVQKAYDTAFVAAPGRLKVVLEAGR